MRAQLAQLGRGNGTAQPTRHEIEEEARELYARSKRASPAETAEIEKRGAELLRQFQMLSQPSRARAKSAARP